VATNGEVQRRTVDLAAYPDLVVIYLGMRVNAFAGLKTLFGFGPKIANAVRAAPASGMKATSCGAGWKRSMTAW
jgi:hypothetical protein